MKCLRFIVVAGLLISPLRLVFAVQKAVVVVPVADLRSDQSLPEPGKSDDKQQTQLLFGETVEVVKSSGDWVYVNAIEQPEFTTHQKWEGYPGWALKSALKIEPESGRNDFITKKWSPVYDVPGGRLLMNLPLGTATKPIPNKPAVKGFEQIDLFNGRLGWIASQDLMPILNSWPHFDGRREILQTAELLVGTPYAWGGLSPLDQSHQTKLSGVDCSGLVFLSYRVNHYTKQIPRDSMEQYMKATKIKRAELKPADLVFSAKADKPEKITHVALYAGKGQLIEAPQTGMVVRKISFKEKFGQDFEKVESGDKVGDRVIYFGRLLKD